MNAYKIRFLGKTWGVIEIRSGKLVEGGFFTKEAAERACEDHEIELQACREARMNREEA